MRKFYQTYKIKEMQSVLSWSHYRELLQIEDSSMRRKLEAQAIQEGWSQLELQKRVKQALAGTLQKQELEKQDESINKRLKRPLMRLHLYRTLQKYSSDLAQSVPNLDLGFSVIIRANDDSAQKSTFLSNLNKFKVGSVVASGKKGSSYYFESVSSAKEMYTYKAFLERVIDGDTLLVNIDLGFSVFIEQRLRLHGLDAPELGTREGNAAKKFIETRLKDCKFLIIKTHGSDKYDRYLVDVFYLKDEDNEDKVLKEGIFFNNEILEEGLALVVE